MSKSLILLPAGRHAVSNRYCTKTSTRVEIERRKRILLNARRDSRRIALAAIISCVCWRGTKISNPAILISSFEFRLCYPASRFPNFENRICYCGGNLSNSATYVAVFLNRTVFAGGHRLNGDERKIRRTGDRRSTRPSIGARMPRSTSNQWFWWHFGFEQTSTVVNEKQNSIDGKPKSAFLCHQMELMTSKPELFRRRR